MIKISAKKFHFITTINFFSFEYLIDDLIAYLNYRLLTKQEKNFQFESESIWINSVNMVLADRFYP